MTNSLSATTLAQDFERQGLAGTWLSRKRTDFLRDLARRAPADVRYDGETHTYHGGWEAEGDLVDWSLYISPLNGCGLFNIKRFTVAQQAEAEAKARYEARCKALNDKVLPLMLAGKSDEVRALLEAFAAEEAR
jgi:hypothetical protein